MTPPPPRPPMSGSARGTLIHELLATLDFKQPSLAGTMPADVRGALTGLLGSATFARLAALRDVRREQRFAFAVGETLITGVFDVLAREDRFNQVLVVDYKSDRLSGTSPYAIVEARYQAQRTLYALAALKLGAPAVEVLHLFLEAPEDPVTDGLPGIRHAHLGGRPAQQGCRSADRQLPGDRRPGPSGLRRLPRPGRPVLVAAGGHERTEAVGTGSGSVSPNNGLGHSLSASTVLSSAQKTSICAPTRSQASSPRTTAKMPYALFAVLKCPM